MPRVVYNSGKNIFWCHKCTKIPLNWAVPDMKLPVWSMVVWTESDRHTPKDNLVGFWGWPDYSLIYDNGK